MFGVVILSWTALYYVSSATSGIWNKQLVDGGAVSPTLLTLLHLLVSLASDVAVMRVSKDGAPEFPPRHGRHTLWDIFAYFIPISIFVTLSKLATYLSYQSVSIALSHTAKASEPIFNAVVAAILFKEHYAPAVYISLVPIALGVTLASTTDFTYNHVGVLWAIGSALTKVLQNIYTKKLMLTGKFNFFEIHMYCGAASLLILAPVMIYEMAGAHHNPFAQ
jgi:solute carrier family 35 protein E1